MTCAGLPAGTIRVSVFEANARAVPLTRPAEEARSMLDSSAVASTSAAAPAESWSTRVVDPSKENRTLAPGCAASNWAPSWVKA